jgi:hypothetical protein
MQLKKSMRSRDSISRPLLSNVCVTSFMIPVFRRINVLHSKSSKKKRTCAYSVVVEFGACVYSATILDAARRVRRSFVFSWIESLSNGILQPVKAFAARPKQD